MPRLHDAAPSSLRTVHIFRPSCTVAVFSFTASLLCTGIRRAEAGKHAAAASSTADRSCGNASTSLPPDRSHGDLFKFVRVDMADSMENRADRTKAKEESQKACFFFLGGWMKTYFSSPPRPGLSAHLRFTPFPAEKTVRSLFSTGGNTPSGKAKSCCLSPCRSIIPLRTVFISAGLPICCSAVLTIRHEKHHAEGAGHAVLSRPHTSEQTLPGITRPPCQS